MKLKPCPFCLSEKIKLVQGIDKHWYTCFNCLTNGPYEDDNLKHIRWNVRPKEVSK